MRIALVAVLAVLLTGCLPDDNDKPKFGDSGLPVNCRAYVQVSVDGYRNKTYSADEVMNGLERNCGTYGHAWKNNR
ncbi:hypothetical protein [uncultured Rhodoferax sp.]|uniref:hypothetical protein n=1 Tax=uncultured Rhodoferax sp. TaxID=223188 RepID=UPI0025D2C41B|nr:hypothetical protein [uncultured Rhodoferax sp.]